MITLTIDPNTETPPDFSKEEHSFTREAVMLNRNGINHEQAAGILENLWREGLERRKTVWEAEREEREAEARRGQQDRGEAQRNHEEVNASQPTLSGGLSPQSDDEGPNLIVGKPVPEVIEYPPARFAIKKLREREYIELSYFTPEGRAEAARNESVASNDVFTLTKEDDVLALKPVVNVKAKGKAAQDEELSWDQLCIASTNFLEHIVQEKWPNNMVDAMHTFFFRLTNHKLRNEGTDGLKVLTLYQARVRREWHRQIKNPPRDGIFDVGLIDDRALRTLKDQVYDAKRSAIIADVYGARGLKFAPFALYMRNFVPKFSQLNALGMS